MDLAVGDVVAESIAVGLYVVVALVFLFLANALKG